MKLKPFLALLAMTSAVSAAWADDASNSNITISGFGTAALTRTNTSDAEFARPNQSAGAKDKFVTGVDSNFGVQVTAQMTDTISLTGQGLVRKLVTDNYGAELAWAFAKIKLSDNMNVRIGRMGEPIYMLSDYRSVGYANTMVRPPIEMYTQVPLESSDGVDFSYYTNIGETALSAQVFLVESDADIRGGYKAKAKKNIGINLTAETGPFSYRFGWSRADLSMENNVRLNTLISSLTNYGFKSIADTFELQGNKATFMAVGATMDWKNVVVAAEYGKRKVDSRALADTTSWYTMVGYRIGKFLPYFNHASATQDTPRTVSGLPTTGPLAALNAAATSVVAASPIQTSNSIGVRWDFNKSAALKLQFDRVSPESGSGVFVNAKPNFTGPVNVFTAAVDFVF